MDINYPIVGAVLLFMILLIIFIIRRNLKDEREFEEELNQPDPEDPNEKSE
ncbi:hypothetical protein [Pedobacter sp. L105]|uniref:hypothetical protein n=1 Tax=Pedobacter sp. L105 TaxID=1641871 RepID=UPI00131DA3AE|nr:hypothetical protein [Pedobacter sp. L105]